MQIFSVIECGLISESYGRTKFCAHADSIPINKLCSDLVNVDKDPSLDRDWIFRGIGFDRLQLHVDLFFIVEDDFGAVYPARYGTWESVFKKIKKVMGVLFKQPWMIL